MRLPADEQLASETVAAAAGAGVSGVDTAHAYAPEPFQLGHNERVLARPLRRHGRNRAPRLVTKG